MAEAVFIPDNRMVGHALKGYRAPIGMRVINKTNLS